MEYNAQTIIFADKVVIKQKKKKKKKKENIQKDEQTKDMLKQDDTIIISKQINPIRITDKKILDDNLPICMYGVPPIPDFTCTGINPIGLLPTTT